MNIVFMGTPDVAADVLQRIAKCHHVLGVFCQPDKPVGRHAVLTPPPVKIAALELGLPVFQPRTLRDGGAEEQLRALAPDLIVVVAYGKILPPQILSIPPHGCVNLHVSLLPKYRGAAPIQHALLNGEHQTGVTVMYMDEGMDTGDIIAQRAFEIQPDDDAASIFQQSADIGGQLLQEALAQIEQGTAPRTPQNHDAASFAPTLTKEMARFSFFDDARTIVNRVRGLSMWPVAEFMKDGRRVKVLKAALIEEDAAPGTVLSLDPLTVAAKDGAVALLSVKPEGSREMSGRDFAAGLRIKKGDTLCI